MAVLPLTWGSTALRVVKVADFLAVDRLLPATQHVLLKMRSGTCSDPPDEELDGNGKKETHGQGISIDTNMHEHDINHVAKEKSICKEIDSTPSVNER